MPGSFNANDIRRRQQGKDTFEAQLEKQRGKFSHKALIGPGKGSTVQEVDIVYAKLQKDLSAADRQRSVQLGHTDAAVAGGRAVQAVRRTAGDWSSSEDDKPTAAAKKGARKAAAPAPARRTSRLALPALAFSAASGGVDVDNGGEEIAMDVPAKKVNKISVEESGVAEYLAVLNGTKVGRETRCARNSS